MVLEVEVGVPLPAGWKGDSCFPWVNGSHGSKKVSWQASHAEGDTIDVRWDAEKGAYVCKLVKDGRWDEPADVLTSVDPAEVLEWLLGHLECVPSAGAR